MFSVGQAKAESVSIVAADGVKIYGEYRGGKDGARPLILLFHQAGSSHHEYDTIAPELNALGFDTLAIDQRSGGSLFGQNRTAAGTRGGSDFLAAFKDLEAALAWGREHNRGNLIAWGSSYSASLVFLLAAQHPGEVSAILSFSPGEYFSNRTLVRDAAAKITVPVFVSSDASSGEVNEAKSILAAVPGTEKHQYVPKRGSHGSSSLREDRNPAGVADNWVAVRVFLSSIR